MDVEKHYPIFRREPPPIVDSTELFSGVAKIEIDAEGTVFIRGSHIVMNQKMTRKFINAIQELVAKWTLSSPQR